LAKGWRNYQPSSIFCSSKNISRITAQVKTTSRVRSTAEIRTTAEIRITAKSRTTVEIRTTAKIRTTADRGQSNFWIQGKIKPTTGSCYIEENLSLS